MGSTLTIIDSNSILPTRGTIVVSNFDKDDKLSLKLYQGDNLLAAKNDYIGTLVYQYDEVKEVGEGHVVVTVDVMRDGIVKLKAHQLLYGEASAQEVELTAR